MRYTHVLFLAGVIVLCSCNKEKEMPVSVKMPPSVAPVLLKDIVESSLPSPYYHFEYDAQGKASFVSFASEFTRYNIIYRQNKISEMRNNILVNKDKLKYVYDNAGRVSTVRYNDSNGVVFARVNFTYDGQQLVKLRREKKSGAGFIIDKIMTFSYYPDGNLFELTTRYPTTKDQAKSVFTDRYEQYDDKINVDGFSLIHNDFFDHLILLPDVQIQKNNPHKETRTGDGLNYVVNYTYTYNTGGAPLIKKGDLVISNGSDSGKKIQISSTFSYY